MKRAHKPDLSSIVMDSSFLFGRCVVGITTTELYLGNLYTFDSRLGKKFKITVMRRCRPDANSDCDSYL